MKQVLLVAFLISASYSFVIGQQCAERDYDCRIKAATKAIEANPKDPENYYEVGRIYQTASLHKKAIEMFSMYLAIPGVKPEHRADALNNRAIAYRALKQFDLAHADLTKAIELNPKDPRPLVTRGNVNGDLRKNAESKADYDRAIEVDPKFALAYTNRGHLHLRTSNYDQAILDVTKAIELEPTNPESFYTRALAYRLKKEYAKAIPDLDRYIELSPSSPRYLADGYVNRGVVYALSGNPEQAVKDFTKAIELAPGYSDAYTARAQAYRDLKKYDLAAADEKTATELSNPNPPAPPKKP